MLELKIFKIFVFPYNFRILREIENKLDCFGLFLPDSFSNCSEHMFRSLCSPKVNSFGSYKGLRLILIHNTYETLQKQSDLWVIAFFSVSLVIELPTRIIHLPKSYIGLEALSAGKPKLNRRTLILKSSVK